jgi:hypothetical protein
MPVKSRDEFVVIARDIDNSRPLATSTQEFLDDVIVRLGPVDSTPQGPHIDEVADDVKGLEIVGAKKAEQSFSLAPASAEVDI